MNIQPTYQIGEVVFAIAHKNLNQLIASIQIENIIQAILPYILSGKISEIKINKNDDILYSIENIITLHNIAPDKFQKYSPQNTDIIEELITTDLKELIETIINIKIKNIKEKLNNNITNINNIYKEYYASTTPTTPT